MLYVIVITSLENIWGFEGKKCFWCWSADLSSALDASTAASAVFYGKSTEG